MIKLLYEFPGYIIESILHLFFYIRLLSIQLTSIKHPLLIMFSYSVTGVVINYIFPTPLGPILFILIIMILIYPNAYNISITNNILCFAITYTIISISEDLIISTMPVSPETLNSPITQVVGELIILFIFFIVFHFISLSRLYNKVINGSAITKIMILLIFLLETASIVVGKIDSIHTLKNLPVALASIFITAMLSILVVYQTHKLDIQKRDLENYHSYQPMLKNLIEDVLSKQHDFNNQLQAVKMLPYTYTNYEDLSREIQNHSSLISSEFKDTELLKINLKVLAGFIYNKVSLTSKEDKQLDVEIKNYVLTTDIPEYELIRVAGILIDNAVEATPKGHTAYLKLDSTNNRIIISTLNEGQNITDEFQKRIFQKGYTTKESDDGHKHGYGLSNLLRITEQYGGEVLLDNTQVNGQTHIHFEVVI